MKTIIYAFSALIVITFIFCASCNHSDNFPTVDNVLKEDTIPNIDTRTAFEKITGRWNMSYYEKDGTFIKSLIFSIDTTVKSYEYYTTSDPTVRLGYDSTVYFEEVYELRKSMKDSLILGRNVGGVCGLSAIITTSIKFITSDSINSKITTYHCGGDPKFNYDSYEYLQGKRLK
jgi:hypothetical protein